jgi:hypothetical protein
MRQKGLQWQTKLNLYTFYFVEDVKSLESRITAVWFDTDKNNKMIIYIVYFQRTW